MSVCSCHRATACFRTSSSRDVLTSFRVAALSSTADASQPSHLSRGAAPSGKLTAPACVTSVGLQKERLLIFPRLAGKLPEGKEGATHHGPVVAAFRVPPFPECCDKPISGLEWRLKTSPSFCGSGRATVSCRWYDEDRALRKATGHRKTVGVASRKRYSSESGTDSETPNPTTAAVMIEGRQFRACEKPQGKETISEHVTQLE
ncbi:hypothetical protein HPB51_027555 [Rhipicephalus microplus]|uniref:Uncharacterized protein n=1 Tax=Rhipicephalus microplus TaxID=6941 RepID=A0A9J6CZL7_RHIMP|nr:hypothetical protein HPB51_027555 [Rhipicephalus microplus]